MGETNKQSGIQKVKGTIAYVEQEPFIFSGTVKDNITFGRKFSQTQFNYAIKVS